MQAKLKPYVVCCEPRIVLFGWLTQSETIKECPTLVNSQMLIYWPASCKGLFGVVKNGPSEGCRVTPPVLRHTIRTKVECLMAVSADAAKKWALEPWG